jgi:hypothetical protein
MNTTIPLCVGVPLRYWAQVLAQRAKRTRASQLLRQRDFVWAEFIEATERAFPV